MADLQQSFVRNRLLRALSPENFALLQPHLERVEAPFRRVLITPNEPVGTLFFPETGYGSVVADGSAGRVEVGLIGSEGLIGAIPVLLASDRTPHQSMVQHAGEMLSIPAGALTEAVAQSDGLRTLLLRYVHALSIQTAATAYSNATYTTEIRLARWLLMCHDRLEGDGIAITHEFLSLMLGVQRGGVTLALQTLEGNGLIKAQRGRITIRDRESLIATADGSYGGPEAEYARLIEGA